MIKKAKRRIILKASPHHDDATIFLWCRLRCSRWSNKTTVGNRSILSASYFRSCEDAWLTAKAQLERISLPFPGSKLRLLAAADVSRIRQLNQILPDTIDALEKNWGEAWHDARQRLRGALDPKDVIPLETLRERHKVELVFEPAAACPNGLASIPSAKLCGALSSWQTRA